MVPASRATLGNGGGIVIRAARPEDAASIAAIYAPHVLVGTVSFETEAPDARQMRARMAASEGLYPWLVATIGTEGGVLAYAYASAFHKREAYRFACETTVYVADAAQRQGAGRLLYEALIDTLRAQGFTQAIGAIALPTRRSSCMRRSGFAARGCTARSGTRTGSGSTWGIGSAS
jgi:L-amino acid N-acyltransferase YncA